MIDLKKENIVQKQIAVKFGYWEIAVKINEYLEKGFTFIGEFKQRSHDDERIIIFQLPDDKPTTNKNREIPDK